ncbi:3279_t:CDS:2, partial [Racocetra persica]
LDELRQKVLDATLSMRLKDENNESDTNAIDEIEEQLMLEEPENNTPIENNDDSKFVEHKFNKDDHSNMEFDVDTL